MKIRMLFIALIAALPLLANAQDVKPTKHHKKHHKTTPTAAKPLPPWAAAHKYDATSHVYFPDYYTFYDPARGGYVFWEKGQWTLTPALPPYLEKVDLSKSRIQILKNVSLDLHPELDYPRYMELYPADDNGNTKVLVPSPNYPGTP